MHHSPSPALPVVAGDMSSFMLSKHFTNGNVFLVLRTLFLKVSVLCDWWPVERSEV